MKIRSLLTVVAMLSVFLFVGIASAEFGVNDAVPGRDTVIPIICSVDPLTGGAITGVAPSVGMDTLWAIADTSQGATHFAPPSDAYVVCEAVNLFDVNSNFVKDFKQCWTKLDVISDACSLLINGNGARPALNQAERLALRVSKSNALATLGLYVPDQTGPFFMAYVVYQSQQTPDASQTDRFVSWAYLTDLNKGFASGFDPYSVEGGVGPELVEDAAAATAITAESLYPRYFYFNNNSDTFNWWIVLAGRNEYAIQDPGAGYTMHRKLNCTLCNEEEICVSQGIPIPFELNVIDIFQYVSGIPNTNGKLAGFAACHIEESGSININGFTTNKAFIPGSADITALAPAGNDSGFYTIKGWSYERQMESSASLSWDVIHEMHRLYCSGETDNAQTEAGCTPVNVAP